MSRKNSLYQQLISSIGLRLTLFLGVGLCLYLLTAGMGIYALLQQSQGLQELSGHHFQRALIAAELSRDAEVIAAQTFENMLSSDRSASQEGVLDQDLIDFYRSSRERLSASTDQEQTYLDEIDLWQKPYFASLKQLAVRMEEERELVDQEQALLNQLQTLSQQLHQEVEQQSVRAAADHHLMEAQHILNLCITALKADRNGQLFRLQQDALSQLATLQKDGPLHDRLLPLVSRTFSLRKPLILSQRATLASAREARLYAQRLTSSSYNFFQSLKKTALQAATDYQQAARNALLLVGVVSTVFLASVLLMVVFIRRHLVQRLHNLSDVMSAHVQGDPVPVPREGNDEISTIAEAFEVFVKARYSAEQRLKQSRQEAEQANQQLRRLNQQLLQLSETDPLTQVANRRYFDQRLQESWQLARRLNQSVGLIMCDIDFFKRYNDHYGHHAGDRCLQLVADTLRQVAESQPQTLIGRYGGEEFILLQNNSSDRQIRQLADALRLAVQQLGLEHTSADNGQVTLSTGCTLIGGEQLQGQSEQLILEADKALYQAKEQGRNCSVTYNRSGQNTQTASGFSG